VHTILSLIENVQHYILEEENLGSMESEEIQSIKDNLVELVGCLRTLKSNWVDYQDLLERLTPNTIGYQTHRVATGTPGRPRFDVSKNQLAYLASLHFSWTEIAVLLRVSRSTLYRCIIRLFNISCKLSIFHSILPIIISRYTLN